MVESVHGHTDQVHITCFQIMFFKWYANYLGAALHVELVQKQLVLLF